ncbi:MAG: hypothetical protein ACUVSA_02500 [Desulfosoma sp.]|uniref:hypothetical protein n=1 Tax=Desulfosoma sp. TaxID=2603217 RepID=UPI004049BE71
MWAHLGRKPFGLFFLLVFHALGLWGRATAASVPELEGRFLELTQSLRAHPAETLAAFFPETVFPLPSTPLFRTLSAQGLPRLVPHDALARSAEDTLATLLAQAQGGVVSFDLPPLQDRLAAHGYAAVENGEVVVALTFRNFVRPEAAAEALFRQVLAKELAVSDLRQTVLLNPHVREIGLACRTGKVFVHGSAHNAYVLVVHAGAHGLHAVELQLFKELNHWRQNPSMGIFPMFLSALSGKPAPFALDPVPVLVFDPKLYEYARALNLEASFVPDAASQPSSADLAAWLSMVPPLRATVPLNVSMNLEQVTAALWQSLVRQEAARWVFQGEPYALSREVFGGAVHVKLKTADDGTLFLEAVLLVAIRSPQAPWGARLAGSVSATDGLPEASVTIQEVRIVSSATQEIRASALVDTAGGFSLAAAEPFYPPFTPYALVVVDAQGQEILRRPLPMNLDGTFVDVVLTMD